MVRRYRSFPNVRSVTFSPKTRTDVAWFGALTVGLALLWTVDATETNAFGLVIMQDFDRIAIVHADNGAGEFACEFWTR